MKEQTMIIGCIPVWAHPTHPVDQEDCIKESCPSCKKDMWVSKKKREKRAASNILCICLYCAATEIGIENFDIIDLNQVH